MMQVIALNCSPCTASWGRWRESNGNDFIRTGSSDMWKIYSVPCCTRFWTSGDKMLFQNCIILGFIVGPSVQFSSRFVPWIQCIVTAVTLFFICVQTTRRSKNSWRFQARRLFPDLWIVSYRKIIVEIVHDLEMLCHLTSCNGFNLNVGYRALVGYILQLNQVAILRTILPAGLTPPADWSKPHFHLYLWRIKEQSKNLKAQCERILSSFFLLPYFPSSSPPSTLTLPLTTTFKTLTTILHISPPLSKISPSRSKKPFPTQSGNQFFFEIVPLFQATVVF